jgi:hypothetical protein
MGAKLDVIGRMHEQRKEALERLATLKKLGMQTGVLRHYSSVINTKNACSFKCCFGSKGYAYIYRFK